MRKNSSEFKTSFLSEAGTFRSNKDYFAYSELDDAACWVAVDGIDSDEEKESAELVAQSIFSEFLEHPSMSRWRLKRAIHNAHNTLKSESRNVRLKASLLVVISDYSRMIYAVVGNARLYHFRKKRLILKSKDQSVAQMMADSGKITDDDINFHEERHNLISYLGIDGHLKPFVSRKHFLKEGDTLLLTTAGFWENVTNVEVIDALREAEEPEDFTDNLEETMLDKQNEALNNYTIGTVFVNKVFNDNAEKKVKYVKRGIVAAIILLFVFLVVGFGRRQIMAFRYQARYQVQARQRKANAIKAIDRNEKAGDEFVKEGEYKQALDSYSQAINGIKAIDEKSKDLKKELRLRRKYDITQIIVEGDNLFDSRKFQAALLNYKTADLSTEQVNYDRKMLKQRIEKTIGFVQAMDLMGQADRDMERGNYEAARDKYRQAGSLANSVEFDQLRDSAESKLTTVDTKLAENEEKKKKLNSGKNFERQGDRQQEARNYKAALDLYHMAKSAYEELVETQAVLQVQTKIQRTQEKLDRYTTAEEYARHGDERFSAKKYKEAKASYTMAKNIYHELGMTDKAMEIDPKLEEATKLAKWYRRIFRRG
jgi:serine/threonine protein phosphatase PrpC